MLKLSLSRNYTTLTGKRPCNRFSFHPLNEYKWKEISKKNTVEKTKVRETERRTQSKLYSQQSFKKTKLQMTDNLSICCFQTIFQQILTTLVKHTPIQHLANL